MLQPRAIHLKVQTAESGRQVLHVGHLQIDAAGQHSTKVHVRLDDVTSGREVGPLEAARLRAANNGTAKRRIAGVGAVGYDVRHGQNIDLVFNRDVKVIEAGREFRQEAGLQVDADGVRFSLLRLQRRVAPLQL